MILPQHVDLFDDLIASGSIDRRSSVHERLSLDARALRPNSIETLAEIIARLHANGQPFFMLGGGTTIAGSPVDAVRDREVGETTVISMDALDRIVEYRPLDFAITVEAGMPIGRLQELLAMRGQMLPFDTPLAARSTVGGLLATKRIGPRRKAYGAPRDLVAGASLVLADGSVVESGGRLQRHGGGYDVARLFIGSHGMFGAFAAVHLRTLPLALARRCAIATLPEGTRTRVLAGIAALPIEPTAAFLIDGFIREIPGWEGPDGRIMLYFEGSENTISRATRELRTALGAIGVAETRIFDREADTLLQTALDAPLHRNNRENSATLRVFGPPNNATHLHDALHARALEIGTALESITDLHNGDVYVRAKAFGPRALEVSACELFLRAAHEHVRCDLVEAPTAFRQRFENGLPPVEPSSIELGLRSRFDPLALCGTDRTALAS